jgi:hypothetical protein
MQISQAKQKELMLLIHGLRAIYISDSETERHALAVQLETELATRFGVMVGNPEDQERNR